MSLSLSGTSSSPLFAVPGAFARRRSPSLTTSSNGRPGRALRDLVSPHVGVEQLRAHDPIRVRPVADLPLGPDLGVAGPRERLAVAPLLVEEPGDDPELRRRDLAARRHGAVNDDVVPHGRARVVSGRVAEVHAPVELAAATQT